jgi:hypothetical protein
VGYLYGTKVRLLFTFLVDTCPGALPTLEIQYFYRGHIPVTPTWQMMLGGRPGLDSLQNHRAVTGALLVDVVPRVVKVENPILGAGLGRWPHWFQTESVCFGGLQDGEDPEVPGGREVC